MVRRAGLGLLAALLWIAAAAQAQLAAPPDPGRIAGRVIDGGTGRPLSAARISVAGGGEVVQSDLDGRFRSAPLPPGFHSLTVALIGFKPARLDSVRVDPKQIALVTVALSAAPVQLEELRVAAEGPARVSSAQGLLAAQQSAMAVVDGVSAEAISKTPDSDA